MACRFRYAAYGNRRDHEAGNVETILNGGSSRTMERQEVAQRVGRYLVRESQGVTSLPGFKKRAWERVTVEKIPGADQGEDKYSFVVVADPSGIPKASSKLLNPHEDWKLVFAAESGGPEHRTKRTPPTFTYSNEDNQDPLWTKVENGTAHHGISSDDIMQTVRKANIFVYQRKLLDAEYCAGKMLNVLGQQTKVKCAHHKVPVIKVGRVETTCGRAGCTNKSSYVCREVDASGNKCVVSLCLKHFKEAANDPASEVFVTFDSNGRAKPQESYRVTLHLPGEDEEKDGEVPDEVNVDGEVMPDKGTGQEAEDVQKFAASLLSGLPYDDKLVCEISADAEKPLFAVFSNQDRMQGQYLFNE